MSATVLLIEDNEQNRYLVTFLLEKHGFTVIAARDGPTALELAESVEPALILLDIQLPAMDGYAVARALRETVRARMIPIVAVTSYALQGDREKALESGCNGYIEKPIDPDTFIADIGHFLPPRRSR